MRVAVVGCGASGLAALRHMVGPKRTNSGNWEPTVFEMKSSIGGTWVYEDLPLSPSELDVRQEVKPGQSALYSNMLTNLPREIMGFPDFPFKTSGSSFVHHTVVLEYLNNYFNHFKLPLSKILFNTKVTAITRENDAFKVKYNNFKGENTQIFDKILICNGHYEVPLVNLKDFPDINRFNGIVIHSRDYRKPEFFRGKTVLIIGAGPSGLDIAIDIAKLARSVLISHDNVGIIRAKMPENIAHVKLIGFTNDGIRACGFNGDSNENSDNNSNDNSGDNERHFQVDAVVLCTGYKFNTGFLDVGSKNLQNKLDGRVLHGLYRHMIVSDVPDVAFVGICKKVVPFPEFDLQAQFILRSWAKDFSLPNSTSMMEAAEEDLKWRKEVLGMKEHYSHVMGGLQWGYHEDLMEEAGLKGQRSSKGERSLNEEVHKMVHGVRMVNLMEYKKTVVMRKCEVKDGCRVIEGSDDSDWCLVLVD